MEKKPQKTMNVYLCLEILSKTKDVNRGKVLGVTDGVLCGYRFDKMVKTA